VVVVAVTVVAVVVEVETVVVVVAVIVDEVVVDVGEVVVVDELQDPKTSDINITPVSIIHGIPFFMRPPVLIKQSADMMQYGFWD
jgi:hypothetical protein